MRFIPLFLTGVLISSAHLQAALVMTIDPINKEFWLTGTATGTTSSSRMAMWSSGNSSWQNFTGANLSVVTTSSSLLTLNTIRITRDPEGTGATFGLVFGQANTTTTITGAGPAQKVYYGGLGAHVITQFETGIGKTLSNTESGATSFGAITVVPEPSSASLMGLAGALLFLRRRQKQS